MPRLEARQWERLAIDGPGPVQQALMLARLVAAAWGYFGKPPDIHELCPWLDAMTGDPEDAAADRRAKAARARLDAMAGFAAAQFARARRKEADDAS